jgi:hypothetical protein
MAYSRDLTEPLAYALASAGVLAWLEQRRTTAIVLLALAGLTREATLLFPAALAIAEALSRRWDRAVAAALAALPLALWYRYLVAGLNLPPRQPGTGFGYVGANLFSNLSFEIGRVSSLLFVGLPILALAPLAVRWLLRVPRDPIAWAIALHIALALIPAVRGPRAHLLGEPHPERAARGAAASHSQRCSPRFPAPPSPPSPSPRR